MKIEIEISKKQLKLLGEYEQEISKEINKLVKNHIKELYIENNHFKLFRDKHLLLWENEKIKASELFKRYKSYCIKRKIKFIGRNKFYDLVCKLPNVYKHIANNNILTLHNINYKEEEEEEWI